eukprot:4231984-Amphidinium_carterae.2
MHASRANCADVLLLLARAESMDLNIRKLAKAVLRLERPTQIPPQAKACNVTLALRAKDLCSGHATNFGTVVKRTDNSPTSDRTVKNIQEPVAIATSVATLSKIHL